MRVKIWMAAWIGLFLLCGVAGAEFYKWVDRDGGIHFSDERPDGMESVGEVETLPAQTNRTRPAKDSADDDPLRANDAHGEDREFDKPKRHRPPEVELYTTSWCGYCGKARTYFWIRGIPFKEYDIEKDRRAARRKKELDPRGGVPFAVINGQPIHGFSPAAYTRALKHTP
jgi:glutaredoxin